MKKLCLTLTTMCIVAAAVGVQAGDKRYRIRLAAKDGDVFGKPVSFQEVVPTPTPYAPPPATPSFAPVPEPQFAPPVLPHPAPVQPWSFTIGVKYSDLQNVHPHAVKKIVAVKDPCAKRDPCLRCPPPCVYVMICVPPCDKFEFDVKRKDHSKVEYDYGDYEVEITSKDGVVKSITTTDFFDHQ